MNKIVKTSALLLVLVGVVFAGFYFNNPQPKPTSFVDKAPYINHFERGGQRIVEWTDGKYEIFPTGAERVTPYWGPITLAIHPERSHCPQDIIIKGYEIAGQYCYEGKVGGWYKKIGDLPAGYHKVLMRGRVLAFEHWPEPIPKYKN